MESERFLGWDAVEWEREVSWEREDEREKEKRERREERDFFAGRWGLKIGVSILSLRRSDAV